MNGNRIGLVLALSLLLAACSDGGNGTDEELPDSGNVALATKADLLRELGVVGAIDRAIAAVDGRAVTARAVSTVNCNISGTYTGEDGSRSYTFDLFDSQPRNMQFFRATGTDCKNSRGDGSVVTSRGVQEFGTDNGATTRYGYVLLGAAGAALEITVQASRDSSDLSVDALSGGVQLLETSASNESRTLATLEHYQQNATTNRLLSLKPGVSGAPFKRLQVKETGALSFEGPYAYSGSNCDGGKAAVTTPTTLSVDLDQGIIDGGKLKLSAGTANVTLTFAANGSAGFQFEDGLSGTLTLTEIQQALSAGSC